jgi:hypothetical protein
MNALFPIAAILGIGYLLTRPAQNSGDPKTWDVSQNPTLKGLSPEVQAQISQIIATGTKAQLLAMADHFEKAGRPDVAYILRTAAAHKAV